MKLILPLTALSLLAASPVFASRTIVWASDQFVRTGTADTSDNDGGTAGRFSSGAGPYADEPFVALLRNAGYTVQRYNPPSSTLPAAEIAQLNTYDLIILGRTLGSGAFDSAAEALAWNNGVTKPLICTNTYLSRSNRLGWFSAATPTSAPVQPDQLLNPLTFTDLLNPAQLYLAGDAALSGSTTVDSITEVFNFPNDNAADLRGISNLTGSTLNPAGTTLATSFITATSLTAPYIVSLPAGTTLNTTGTGAVASGQVLGGYRLQFLAGIRESATAPNNGVRNAGYESMTPVGESMFLRAVALAMNSGSVPADADNDGVPDSWETSHFGGPATTTGLADDDGDGLSNLIEYAFSLNPVSGDLSAFSIGSLVSGLMEVSITKQPYCCYVVESSADLQTWTRDNPADNADGMTTILDDATTLRVRETASANRRTFRVRVYPMPL